MKVFSLLNFAQSEQSYLETLKRNVTLSWGYSSAELIVHMLVLWGRIHHKHEANNPRKAFEKASWTYFYLLMGQKIIEIEA